ncbi:MAG: hypothetical protein AB1489_28155 [Acidobacteriota bacterium]
MIKEEFIRQVAGELSQRLLAGEAAVARKDAPLLLLYATEASEATRNIINAACPEAMLVNLPAQSGTNELITSCTTLVVVAPSLDLASRIVALQVDCPAADFIVRTLFANKRVIFVTEGMLAGPTPGEHLRPGIFRAIEELRSKLAGLGIELITATELNRALHGPTLATPPSPHVKGASQLPILNMPSQIFAHPSQQRFRADHALNDFVEFLQNKQCIMEKGKPCDHCDICNTLGF